MLRVLALTVLFCSSAVADAQSVQERAKKDELVFMNDDEPAMREAFQKARDSLDEFLSKAKSPAPGTTGYSLKVGIRDGEKVEYFWIGDFLETATGFTGTISNHPRMVKRVSFGQRYSFEREHIVDWTYVDRNEKRMVGNFTVCALLTKEPAAQAEATKKRYGLRCE